MVMSLSTILIDLGRFMLASPDGLPFGLLISPFAFSQPSYFASEEFGASIKGLSDMPTKKSRMQLFFLLTATVVCGGVAATAGPSSAMLMIPRLESEWPCEGTDFWMKGSPEDLWPSILKDSSFGGENSDCTDAKSKFDPVEVADCPLGNYANLKNHWAYAKHHARGNQTHQWVGEEGFYRRVMYIQARTQLVGDSWAVSPHLASARGATYVQKSWDKGAEGHGGHAIGRVNSASKREHRKLARSFKTIVKAYGPVVRARCANFESFAPIYEPLDHTFDVTFPNLSNGGTIPLKVKMDAWNATEREAIKIHWNAEGAHPELDKQSISFTIFAAESPESSKSKFGVFGTAGCTVEARWALGKIITDASVLSAAIQFELETSLNGNKKEKEKEKHSPYWHPGHWQLKDNDPIRIDETARRELGRYWEKHENSGGKITSLGALLYVSQETGVATLGSGVETEKPAKFEPILMETIISSYFADVLSRMGFRAQDPARIAEPSKESFDLVAVSSTGGPTPIRTGKITPKEATEMIDGTRLKLEVTLEGYVMAITEWFHWCAFAILATYLLIAVLYTAGMLYKAESSKSWDSLCEIIAIAHGSRPSQLLRNTCAGIRSAGTLRNNVRIGVAKPSSHKKGEEATEELQLIFRGDENEHLYDEFGSIPLDDMKGDFQGKNSKSSARYRKYGSKESLGKDATYAMGKMGKVVFSREEIEGPIYSHDTVSTTSSRTLLLSNGSSVQEDYELSRVPYAPASVETAYTGSRNSSGYRQIQNADEYGYVPPLAEEFPFYPNQQQTQPHYSQQYHP